MNTRTIPRAYVLQLWRAGYNSVQIAEKLGVVDGAMIQARSVQHVICTARKTDSTVPLRKPGYRGIVERSR